MENIQSPSAGIMKKKTLALLLSLTLAAGMIGGCGSKTETTTEENVQTAQTEAVAETGTETVSDQDAADHVAALIDAIYVQERTDETDAQCAEAKAAWDALTDAQKELVEGENADPDYFGRDTGDASKDDPLNAVLRISEAWKKQSRRLIRTGR